MQSKLENSSRPVKAVALYSGGLDSTLAILTVLRQGIEVKAVTFLNHFGCDISDKSSCSKDPFSAAEKFGFEVKLCHLADKFIRIVKDPKFGHGKNMNPCIDCRIFMLEMAKELMDVTGADFIITGEVIGQRPMSQTKDMLYHIDREAGVIDLVLRPLSAKILRATSPERRELIDRDMLYAFSGRSRKPQMALAIELGLEDYPSPAGGCLLTEPNYAYRLKDLLTFDPAPSLRDVGLLRTGRHFRFSPSCKIVIGRDEAENEIIESVATGADRLLRVEGHGSPVTLVAGGVTHEALKTAAALCARYSDAKGLPFVDVRVFEGGPEYTISAEPAGDDVLREYRIELNPKTASRKMRAL